MKIFGSGLVSLLVCLYPFVIFFGAKYLEPRFLALFLFLILCLRFLTGSSFGFELKRRHKVIVLVSGLVLVVLTLASNSLESLKLYPVIINLSFLSVFSYSLYYPPTIIERFARLQLPDPSTAVIIYTRQVTKIWCMFFVINGLIALYTSLFASEEIWILYNGLITYLIMGALLAGEFAYRKLVIKPDSQQGI